jgi:parallel beta-helix repeat protein
LGLALACGVALAGGLLLAMGTLAQGPAVRYVAPAPDGADRGNDCADSSAPCATVQHAVDAAEPGDEIRVASGVYSDVQARAGISQVAAISKTVTLRGGYTTTNWTTAYPISQPTTLDAHGEGRVLTISGAISPTVEGLHLTGGDANGLGGSPSGDSGGGVLVISATLTLSECRILSNSATFGGGLQFYNSPGARLRGNTVGDNSARTQAGGLYFRNSPGATLISNTIRDNHVGPGPAQQYYGGAWFLNSDSATLRGNVIRGNYAQHNCGGLCFQGSRDISLEGNIVLSNTAGGLGGGLYLYNSAVTLTNDVIADNEADIGSGLCANRSSARLLHTTIARNVSDGLSASNGVFATDDGSHSSTVALTNTIVVSHMVGITVTTGSTVTVDGVLWFGNGVNYGGPGTITVTHEYSGNPAFAADGYHLRGASAAIDKGAYAEVDEDVDGDLRPQGGGYDLGADEFVRRVYLPAMVKNSGG